MIINLYKKTVDFTKQFFCLFILETQKREWKLRLERLQASKNSKWIDAFILLRKKAFYGV